MAKKKSSNKAGMFKLILTIIAVVFGVTICIPLFVNVWNAYSSATNTVSTAGNYFDDYSAIAKSFKAFDATFMPWASMVAGIALIIALVGALLYIVGAVMGFENNKLANTLAKVGSIIMIAGGIVILVASLLFIIPAAEGMLIGKKITYSMTLGLGGWIGVISPLVAGVSGLLSTRK